MKTFGRFLICVLFLGNLAYMGALSLHVVKSPSGMALVPKGQTSLLDTIVDTRNWTTSDLREHQAVVDDINRAGKSALISHVGSPVTTVTPAAVPTRTTEKPAPATPETPDKNIFDFTK